MQIIAEDIGKKYGRNWIFRHLNFEINGDEKTAITGANGSGKSTLLQIISGYLTPSRGKISIKDGPALDELKVAYVAPYSEVIEEFSLHEFLRFHSQFRHARMSMEEMSQRASLPLNRPINEFSTGMKQRVKLITAFFFENELVLMDEPTSNLDQEGIDWWKSELNQQTHQTMIIASNQRLEIEMCAKTVNL